jgi:hypothetical protein
MRIGLVYEPRPRTWPKFQWVADALLELGHALIHLTSIEMLMDVEKTCDLVLFEHRENPIGRKQIAKQGAGHKSIWVQWWFDLLIEQRHQDLITVFGDLMRTMDFVAVKERCVDRYQQEFGINAFRLDQGCPPWMGAVQYQSDPEFDVVIFGTRMEEYSQRYDEARILAAADFRVAWAGDNGLPPPGVTDISFCPAGELPALLSRGAVCLCVDLRDDVPGYWSDRVWLAGGAGAFVLHRHILGDPGPEFPHQTYEDGLTETVSSILLGGKWSEIGRLAREIVMRDFTYAKRCQELINVCCR